jgi:hypothetical protein
VEITSNTAGQGGGLIIYNGEVSIVNSTISNNILNSSENIGGIFILDLQKFH